MRTVAGPEAFAAATSSRAAPICSRAFCAICLANGGMNLPPAHVVAYLDPARNVFAVIGYDSVWCYRYKKAEEEKK